MKRSLISAVSVSVSVFVGCALTAAGQATAVGTAVTDAAHPTYVVTQPICGTRQVGHMGCLSWRLVRSSTSRPGARQLTVRPGVATGPAGGYTPSDLASAYGVNPNSATSQVVGIVDAYNDPNARADLDTFDSHYGLPAETASSLKTVSQTGSATGLPVGRADWAGEQSLDLDAVRGLCHRCRIVVVEAKTDSDADLEVAEDEAVAQGATVVSNSFGEAATNPVPSAMQKAFNHRGVVIVAGAGDDGWFGWDVSNAGSRSADAPFVPAALNTVVAVGGTSLTLSAKGRRSSETVWNDNGQDDLLGSLLGTGLGATGGGCSSSIAAQRWQSSVAGYARTGCGMGRLSADVAALADPETGFDVYDSYQATGWETVGGTSLATPLIAAMWALAGGSGGLAYPSLSLYGHFATDHGASLYDVTEGGSGYCDADDTTDCTSYIGQSPNTLGYGQLDCAFLPGSAKTTSNTSSCDAAVGYDGPSGVGTPSGLRAFAPMYPLAMMTIPAATLHHKAAVFAGRGSTDPFPGGRIVTYSWTWGDGTSTTTNSVTASHTYAKAGSYDVKLVITDSYGQSGSTTSPVSVG